MSRPDPFEKKLQSTFCYPDYEEADEEAVSEFKSLVVKFHGDVISESASEEDGEARVRAAIPECLFDTFAKEAEEIGWTN